MFLLKIKVMHLMRNWRFYTGEWHEDLYPGYSFYVQFRGTLGILYEQSRMAEDGVKDLREHSIL